MEKRVLLTELVDRGTHLRKEITPTATITDNGKYPAGTFWDANKTLNEIVAGATDAQDTLKEVEDKLNKEISDARKAEQDIKDQIDDILGIDAQDIADLKQIVEDLDPETGILSVIDAKANTADISVAVDNTNGHAYVDLGLPSGTLWATMNVGASKETDSGEYYMYGKTTTYNDSDTIYDGTENPLSLSADVARVNWGGDWHIPTKDQLEELIANTNYSWQFDFEGSGVNGVKLTNKTDDSKYIFLPAAGILVPGNNNYNYGTHGMYGSSTPVESDTNITYWEIFQYSSATGSNNSRNLGTSIRPVIDSIHTGSVLGKTATDDEKAAWNSKVDFSDLGTAAYKDVAASGNASNTQVVMGNDTRLTDARTPLSHTHSYDSLTNKPDLSLKANVSDISVSMSSTNNHDYVEIAGVKWATMNIGASTETDAGLFFSWGDTKGYSRSEIGYDSDQHSFEATTYVLGMQNESTGQWNYIPTKYNDTDEKKQLELEDDGARANWGGKWRIPTRAECEALCSATTQQIVENYNNTDVTVIVFTDKTDNTKLLILPCAGSYLNGSSQSNNWLIEYWTSTLHYNNYYRAYDLVDTLRGRTTISADYGLNRKLGLPIRAVFTGDDTYGVLGKTVTDAEKSAWNAKADASNYYTKAEIDLMLANL